MFEASSHFSPSFGGSFSSPSLFGKPSQHPPRQLAAAQPPRTDLGYFVFAPTTTNAVEDSPSSSSPPPSPDLSAEERARREFRERAAQLVAARRAAERAEALKGEFDWVRSGGMLRDAHYRPDKARTEAIRAEIRLQDKEASITREWDGYEAQWHNLLASEGPVRFGDIPWPQARDRADAPLSLEALDASKMAEFLLASLTVRGNKLTRKERVRASWLRWHPDKMTALLTRIIPQDIPAVNAGISVVMTCLKNLQDGA
ncbi:hypothetical protein HGRIS_000336 [Hohenbuehelia grisea]|uniref:Uncharacterized protein n=1 Tax=Hohenbuehelia grisea TaxID=104357 RepID=A0ABR3JQS0_9AGAR